MKRRDHSALLTRLAADYELHSPRSAAVNREALRHLVDGGSHTIRLLRPFPPRIASAQGAFVTDEDGHRILDFWQGHYANILGHNPAVVTEALARAFGSRYGLQTGFTDALQVKTAELLCARTGAERVRFTSSGSLATMYATFLSRGFTGREAVMKVGGGWHGAQPWGLVGVDYHAESAHSFEEPESKGLPHGVAEQVIVTRFNDVKMLEQMFAKHGSRIACFIFEPFLGSGGFLSSTREFLQAARELTRRHGALLVFDEVISGFRFCAGSITRLFGIQPDLATYAKVMGGGMPVAAVAGREDVMKLAGRGGGVKFSGGTYSCHPASMLASRTMMEHLVKIEGELYPRLAALAEKARAAVEKAFAGEGLAARCTAGGATPSRPAPWLPCTSRMIRRPRATPRSRPAIPTSATWSSSDTVVQLALLLEDVFVMHGLGAMSIAHTEADIEKLAEACGRAGKRIAPLL